MSSPDRIALVTGGSRGLGRSTVLSLARRGVHSIFTFHSNRAEADKVVALVGETGAQAIALQLDTGNVDAFDDFVARVRDALHRLGAQRFDYLVNNAGTSHHNSFDRTTAAELDALYNVHFKGVFFLTQKLLPLLNDGGRIVNLSSGLTRLADERDDFVGLGPIRVIGEDRMDAALCQADDCAATEAAAAAGHERYPGGGTHLGSLIVVTLTAIHLGTLEGTPRRH
jgi:NAD(P)-dependent dehydrogenase (short-subunit alcohol dehydrogenase family)